ncbi:MAG: hypothetical protein JW746_01675 [Candidatus Krumholzibacteriota bacterium]|nr:hypothetical protein [Candidatus Krumholzibacteriota bacterium]
MSLRDPVIFVLVLALVLPLCSCRNNLYSSIDLSDMELSEGEGIDIDARLLTDAKEIEDLFGAFLPDYGILPLLVAIRNNDTVPFRIYSRNSLDLRDDFKGFSLHLDGKEIFPVHPAQVIEAIKGLSSPADYRKYGGKDIAAGVVVAPLGVVYAWKGFKEYREYRPLINASLLPADHGGTFRPLMLEPGEEINGYLYFPLMPDEVPYKTEEIKVTKSNKIKTGYVHIFNGSVLSGAVLKARISDAGIDCIPGCDKLPGIDSLEISQSVFCRNDREISKDPLSGSCGRALFVLTDESGEAALLFTGENVFSGEKGQDLFEIKRFRGSSAVIADAEQYGGYLACAVNFKRKAKVFVIYSGGSGKRPEITAVRDYEKKVRRVFLSDEGFTVITDNAFCYFESYSGGNPAYRKISGDLQDAYVLREGSLFVLSGDEAGLLSASEDNRFRAGKRISLPKAERDICGSIDTELVAISRGRGGRGDTLVAYDTVDLKEKARIPFRGKIETAEVYRGGILARLEEGTILDIQLEKTAGFRIHHSGWSSSKFLSMISDSGYLTAIDAGGGLLCAEIDLMLPRAVSAGGKKVFTTAVGEISPSGNSLPEKK